MTDRGDHDPNTATLAGEDASGTGPDLGLLDEPIEHDEVILYYGSVDEFLWEYLRSVYKRGINGRSRVWAARWREYPETVIRPEALWRAWEHYARTRRPG